MNKLNFIILAILVGLTAIVASAQDEDGVPVPDEVRPFIETGKTANEIESGDLNADGKEDYILVISKPAKTDGSVDDGEDDKRSTLILVRDAAGKLVLAGRNDEVAFARNAGGVFGDPFVGVRITGTGFTVDNYGGSNWRWADSFTFKYSRRDKQWELTRVEDSSFFVFKPTKIKTIVYTPPRSFGLISFNDFDPEHFKGKGKKK